MIFQSENHAFQILEALQKKTRYGCEIFLSGNDNSRYQSDSLWILSPLVRSIIDSLRDIRDNLIVLPDFSYEDIKAGLEITEGHKGEVLRFNSSTKQLLETLGICFDVSDEPEHDNDTMVTSNIRTKAEITDDDNEEIKNHLMMAQDLSDSDEDSEDDSSAHSEYDMDQTESVRNLVEKDYLLRESESTDETVSNLNQRENQKMLKINDKFIQDLFNKADSYNVTPVIVEEESDTENQSEDGKLKFHQKQKQKEGRWKCPHCPKLLKRGYNLRVHIERIHSKTKPWQCQFCEKTFATSSDLNQHLSSHGKGKILKCEDCGREFRNRDSAILHRKRHNNERTHFCQDCGKGFFKSSCLQRHIRSHTGEKPYNCELCGRGFSQLSTLKNHKKVCKSEEKALKGQS